MTSVEKHLLFRTDDAFVMSQDELCQRSTVQFCWQTLSWVLGWPI